MPNSLRVRIKKLYRNKVFSKNDLNRILGGLDIYDGRNGKYNDMLDKVIEDMKLEIQKKKIFIFPVVPVDEVLDIIDKHIENMKSMNNFDNY